MEKTTPAYKHEKKESYSSINCYENCPYNYFQKYINKHYSDKSTIALEIGNLIHGVMEVKMTPNNFSTEEELEALLHNGKQAGRMDSYKGLDEIKDIYFEIFGEAGRKSGLTYYQKLDNFYNRMYDKEENGLWSSTKEWNVLAVEFPFEFPYRGITLQGKIDKIEINRNGDFRVVDYKTSDSPFDEKKLKNPLQGTVYMLAMKHYFGKYPIEFDYDLIFLGQHQEADLSTWSKNGTKKLDKLIDKMLESYNASVFPVKPSPLCYWCNFNKEGIVQDPKTKDVCEYYSLWTPTNKTWSVNKKWGDDEIVKPISVKKDKIEFIF